MSTFPLTAQLFAALVLHHDDRHIGQGVKERLGGLDLDTGTEDSSPECNVSGDERGACWRSFKHGIW